MKKPKQTKYQLLSYLLGEFGLGRITRDQFWGQMKQLGYTQDDIDKWCDEFYQLEAKKELDDARRKETQGGTERAEPARFARGAGIEGQRADRQDVRAAEGIEAEGQDSRHVQEGREARADQPLVILSAQWVMRAGDIGKQRQSYADRQGLENHGTPDGGEIHHIKGAIAECAVAAYFKLRWRAHIGSLDGVDVGGLIEARTRIIPGTGTDMAIRPDDKDMPHVHTHIYSDNSVRLIGWLAGGEGKDGKRGGRWNNKSSVWFVPPPYRPISELVAWIEERRE